MAHAVEREGPPDPSSGPATVAPATPPAIPKRWRVGQWWTNRRAVPVESTRDLARLDQKQDIGLKKTVARLSLSLMFVQLVYANVVFTIYGSANHWRIDGSVIEIYFSGTVVQIVGVVVIIGPLPVSPPRRPASAGSPVRGACSPGATCCASASAAVTAGLVRSLLSGQIRA